MNSVYIRKGKLLWNSFRGNDIFLPCWISVIARDEELRLLETENHVKLRPDPKKSEIGLGFSSNKGKYR